MDAQTTEVAEGRRRAANLTRPETIFEAKERLEYVQSQIAIIRNELALDFRLDDNGVRLPPKDFLDWRRRATGVMNWFTREKTVVLQYIYEYEKEVNKEEYVERHTLRQQRYVKHQARHAELVKQKAENIAREEQKVAAAKAEKAERAAKHNEAMLEARKKKEERRLVMESEQRCLASEIDITDPISIALHMSRFVRLLRAEGRVIFTEDEQAQFNLLQECIRQIIADGIQKQTFEEVIA